MQAKLGLEMRTVMAVVAADRLAGRMDEVVGSAPPWAVRKGTSQAGHRYRSPRRIRS